MDSMITDGDSGLGSGCGDVTSSQRHWDPGLDHILSGSGVSWRKTSISKSFIGS